MRGLEWGRGSPVHDDVHVAAVSLEAGTQPDVVPPDEAHLHGVVSHHLGVVLQGSLQLQQSLLRLLTAQEKTQPQLMAPWAQQALFGFEPPIPQLHPWPHVNSGNVKMQRTDVDKDSPGQTMACPSTSLPLFWAQSPQTWCGMDLGAQDRDAEGSPC